MYEHDMALYYGICAEHGHYIMVHYMQLYGIICCYMALYVVICHYMQLLAAGTVVPYNAI
jgi:hypothetical protein